MPAVGVGAVVLNVTAAEATEATFVTVWPTGEPRPLASNLNPAPGMGAAPNLVVAKVGAGGQVSFYNFAGTTHLIADVVAWFPEGTGDHDARRAARHRRWPAPATCQHHR